MRGDSDADLRRIAFRNPFHKFVWGTHVAPEEYLPGWLDSIASPGKQLPVWRSLFGANLAPHNQNNPAQLSILQLSF
jgi:hypothetical protein